MINKKLLYIILLSSVWFLFLLFPFVMGVFCPIIDNYCIDVERFSMPLLDGTYPVTEQVVYFLDGMVRIIHRYFSINKLGIPFVALLCIPLGYITFMVGQKLRIFWRDRKHTIA